MAVPRCARDEKSRVQFSGSHTTNGGLIFQASPVFPANLLHCDNGSRGQERLSSFGEDQDEVKTRVTQT